MLKKTPSTGYRTLASALLAASAPARGVAALIEWPRVVHEQHLAEQRRLRAERDRVVTALINERDDEHRQVLRDELAGINAALAA